MATLSCIPSWASRELAEKVVNKLSDEQRDKYGITNDSRKEDAIRTIMGIVERHVGQEADPNKREQMLQDVDAFIHDLDNFFSVVKISEDDSEEAQQQYKEVIEEMQASDWGRMVNFDFAEGENPNENQMPQSLVKNLLSFINSHDKVILPSITYYKNDTVKSISFVIMEPKVTEGLTKQQKTMDTIMNIAAIDSEDWPIDTEITNGTETKFVKNWEVKDWVEKGWQKTGRKHYKYNGKTIVGRTVSDDVDFNPDADYPILSAKIGTQVDTVGRMFFDKSSRLWKDNGELVDDNELKSIINDELFGIFTVQGLKNLVDDFQKLERQLNEKWPGGLQIFSGKLKLFAKSTEEDVWLRGEPDLLVVDKNGIVHVIDFKTHKMSDIKGYNKVFNDEYGTAEKYGKQVSRYIKMLESYGLKVDNSPYIIAIDTWYDSSDHGEKNYDAQGNLKEGRHDIYSVDKNFVGIVQDEQEMTLGEYAESIGNPTRETVANHPERTILYMEPRLHVSHEEGVGFSEELAALRDGNEIPFDDKVSYEQQWEALTDEEKESLRWLNAVPVYTRTAQGIVTLSSNDIESNPDLIGSQEIQDVAEFLMYKVSRIITDLQRGTSYSEFPVSMASEGKESPLKGRDRADIIRKVGIDNLINKAFEYIRDRYKEDFPTEEQYRNGEYDDWEYEFEDEEDFRKQKQMVDKAKWLIDHKEQLIMAGNAKLMALENSIIPKKDKTQQFNPSVPDVRPDAQDLSAVDDNGDNESVESFIDQYIDGITNIEAWMLGQRNYSPKASLAQEIKRLYEDLDMLDSNGKKVKDQYGWGFEMPVDATKAIQTTLDTCKNCETIEEMEEALKDLSRSPQNQWINQILDKINADKNLKKKFFRHFRKDALNYSIAQVKMDKKTGKRIVVTRIVNMKSAEETMRQSLSSSFNNGLVGTFTIEDTTFSLVSMVGGKNTLTKYGDSTVAHQLKKYITTWENRLEKIYKSYNPMRDGKSKEDKIKYISKQIQEQTFDEGKEKITVIQGLTKILQGVGILVPQEVVLDTCLSNVKGEKSNNARTLMRAAREAINILQTMEKEKGIPNGLAGNSAFREYQPMIHMLADSVQEYVEASVYQDGKTYFSYTNPSRIGSIVRNMKDALDDQDKFKKYIQNNFGRYTGWFRSVDDSEWLCDWVSQFADEKHSAARQALAHKVELSYIGNHYRNLGALGFQLSILHNYFGSRDDNAVNKDYRWFALPTMSNKPTNEFIRMLKYKNNDEIIDRVLIKTFQQEMNRMADVLFHYTHHNVSTDQMDITDKKLRDAGWTEEEINGLRSRIDSQSVTTEDLVRLSRITSGAKFHFLWYMNNEMATNPELAERLTERINMLLTPESDAKQTDSAYEAETTAMVRKAIASNMETIVENELQEMRNIGLFDKETKKIKVNGKTQEVEVLKYQEEFNGNLGSDKYGQAEQEMENALRDFIWQDIAANINIIQITGGDLAYYGNAVNYQKRIAQIHSPGLKLMHDDEYDDGYLRSVHISDEHIRDEIMYNTETALNEYMDANLTDKAAREDYGKMINVILSGLTDTLSTDGQSYSSPASIRKKLALQGEWDENREKAYQAISRGDFNINHLGVLIQPSKPFVTSDMAKYSGSTTMTIRKTPLQDKNSEYLIILAEALARGMGKRSKLAAICDFMERTATFGNGKSGIDTAHFASVGKVGVSGVIDIAAFDELFNKDLAEEKVTEDEYNGLLTEYLLDHVRRKSNDPSIQENFDQEDALVDQGVLDRREALYNNQYVDTIPVEDYIIQQEVPAHLLDHEQLYGSQARILGISDITPGTVFQVGRREMSDEELVDEYKNLHAQNIRESFKDLMKELGLDKVEKDGELDMTTIDELPIGSKIRNEVFKNLEFLLQKELSKDAKYGLDMRRACSLQYDREGNVVNFVVPLMDPIQSKRIQMLINSIIKKTINKQKVQGLPLVQTTAYDKNLHIRFKDKDGNILQTLSEYNEKLQENAKLQGVNIPMQQVITQYKEYLKLNQAGIAYFECYMPIPNEQLEKLMLKEDGSMMSFEELQQKLPKEVWDSMSKVLGYRIPTEDKYSMLPLKIMGFVPKAAGQVIMMPQEITYLTGSDFDIDKMYIMMKAFDTDIEGASKENVQSLTDIYLNKTKAIPFKGLQQVVSQVITNGERIMAGDDAYTWTTGIQRDENWEKAKQFVDWYKDYLMQEAFIEYTNQNVPNRRDAKKARDNRILDLQWAVLTNEDTVSKMLNPGNFDPQKKTGRMIRVIKSETINPETEEPWTWEELSDMSIKELDELLENTNPHNTTLPSSKIYFQRQNMQGSQMVGIFANNNVSHAFCTFQKIGIDLFKGKQNKTFMFDGVLIGDPDNPTVLDPQKGFNGQLISKTIASFLAASVDTAKDPTLSDMNVNTFTGGVAMVLARLGFDTEAIGLFLSQPVIVRLSDLYFKNKTSESFYDGNTAIEELAADLGMKKKELGISDSIKDMTLSKENFAKHLNDADYDDAGDNFQKRVLIGFNSLYQIAKDMQELTFCTKFNSVNNAVGPTIADTMEDQDRVNRFINNVKQSCFYEPSSDSEEYTSVEDVITNDPILKAFYETTVDSEGASERIFKNFFPHYFNGFQNVKSYFQEEFMGGKKLSSKLYNQLLDEYLYYLLTYTDDEHKPTLPSNVYDKERLVGGLVRQFQEVLKINGRRPNIILDQNMGGNCLRIREKDEFLAKDILVFNGSQLNADGQQKIRNAWSDLITMNDPNLSEEENEKIRRFGVDLFFYTLMRNGFGFSPKTLMHLASVLVRYNARYGTEFSSYIDGLRGLRSLDSFLMGDNIDQWKRFSEQFIRNHANNRQLVPNIDGQSSLIVGEGADIIEFGAPMDEEYKLSKITVGENPYGFVTITRKSGTSLTQDLYELEEVAGSKKFYENGMVKVRYRKSNRLGLTNNFIEYDANSSIETSYFEGIRNESPESLDDEVQAPEQSRDDQQSNAPMDDRGTDNSLWVLARREMLKLTDDKQYLQKLRKAWDKVGADSDLGNAFKELLAAEQEKKSTVMEKIKKIFDDQNKC